MRLTLLLALLICFIQPISAQEDLPKPKLLILENGAKETNKDKEILAARRYAAFWDTGEAKYAEIALADEFMDRTLPEGRVQGKNGPIEASKGFRSIVPDLKATIEQMIVAGDRVVVQLRFTGHFTGEMNGKKGNGEKIDFVGTDIYKVENGKIIENWHIEDNLKFMKQVGAIK